MALTFEQELEHLINKHSLENGSDTPDFILAQYLSGVLQVWNAAVMRREDWYTDNEAADEDAEDIEDALNAGAIPVGILSGASPVSPFPPDLVQTMREIDQARKEFRAGCRAILWRSLENVDTFAEAIGEVSVGEAVTGWVEDLMQMIGQHVEVVDEESPNESKPS